MYIRRSFKTLAVFLVALGIAQAADIIVTVKGTLAGEDYLGIFGTNKTIPRGTPFTLVYTFDDSKGEPTKVRCANSGSGITGVGENSPGTAVLTIGDASYEFGRADNARSSAWRTIPSPCGPAVVGFSVTEGRQQGTVMNVILHAAVLGRPLTKDADWRSPVSLFHFAMTPDNAFTITRDGSFGLMTRAALTVASVTVGGSEGAGQRQ
jgi:hypothetical protein